MQGTEAKARIKINALLQQAGWRFFDDNQGKANILLESHVKFEDLGDDFEHTAHGFIDFLLLDDNNNPLIVLEAKKESIHPLSAKEQARAYAEAQKVKFVILSNGTIHYLWDVANGNPERISAFPTQLSFKQYTTFTPTPLALVNEVITDDYIAITQLSNYADSPEYQNEEKRVSFIKNNNLRFLRYYQINAVKALQQKVKEGEKRFLFEMATGTGKTLTAAAVIKLFYKTNNARRVLFLVDRLELEVQARKDFKTYLKNDLATVIYKENKTDWQKAEIVVTTIQSLLVNNKYKTLFSPTDFDLIISDEAHRLLGGGNSRALFEYFLGYKLGLTATPKDYLKNVETNDLADPRDMERRMLLDTYTTFGCASGVPTFRYTLAEGAKDKILVQPLVIDARTDVTTKLLSDEGYGVMLTVATSETEDVLEEITYKQRHFERKFFSEKTNAVFVKTFLDNGFLDPLTGEFGKSLVYAVSQNHAAKLAQLFNEYAHAKWPGKYQSNFALQVTSNVANSQQMTVDFGNDKLNGFSHFADGREELEGYKTSKARVCVTVGMMTTGWDCPNILNLALMRPIFSPTEFIQIKGRGTRIHKFDHTYKNEFEEEHFSIKKTAFKLFDFFAVCEYFEEKYNYDQVLKLPVAGNSVDDIPVTEEPKTKRNGYEYGDQDFITQFNEAQVGFEGMKVDRMFFQQFEDVVKQDSEVLLQIEAGNMESAAGLVAEKYIDKPEEYYTLDKLRKALKIDRPITLRELMEQIFYGSQIRDKNELMGDEFEKFLSTIDVSHIKDLVALRNYFYAYLTDSALRTVIDQRDYTELYHNPSFSIDDFSLIDEELKYKLPEYINTYVLPMGKFLSI
jgi:type I restriction enzyme R subunit